MAERRMFAKSIVLSDAFLDMPLSARCLYFTLGMLADDDGFVSSPKAIMRQCGASQDDIKVLISKRYILTFESGVIVIKHWRINNYLRNDRYQQTTYLEEKDTLDIDPRGAYTEKEKVGIPSMGIPSIGKDSIGKDSINNYSVHFEEFWKNYPRKKEKQKAYKAYLARLNDGYSEDQLLTACINYCAECEHTKREERYIKLGATFLSVNEPFVDYLKGETETNDTRVGRTTQSDEEREAEIRRYLESDDFRNAEDEDLF